MVASACNAARASNGRTTSKGGATAAAAVNADAAAEDKPDAAADGVSPDDWAPPPELSSGLTLVWTRRKANGSGQEVSEHSRFTYLSYRPPRAKPLKATSTYFLDRDGKIVALRRGIYIAIGDRLFRFSVQKRYTPYSCEGVVSGKREHERALLTSVPTGNRIEIAPFGDPKASEIGEHTLLASLGPYLFVKTDTTDGSLGQFPGCAGVHPMYGADFRTVEVRGTVAQSVPVQEITAGADAVRAQAQKILDNEFMRRYRQPPCGGDCAATLEPTLAVPSFGPSFGWLVQLSAGAGWTDSDGTWGGYERSAIVPLTEVPVRFRSFAPLAARVASFAPQHHEEWVCGVSHGDVKVPQ